VDIERIRKLAGLNESTNKPTVTYREAGDGSWTVKVDYGNGKVFVHTNKKKAALEKLVSDRYGSKTFA
jgi:hypothetical protein